MNAANIYCKFPFCNFLSALSIGKITALKYKTRDVSSELFAKGGRLLRDNMHLCFLCTKAVALTVYYVRERAARALCHHANGS
jgi:hypothetical protein